MASVRQANETINEMVVILEMAIRGKNLSDELVRTLADNAAVAAEQIQRSRRTTDLAKLRARIEALSLLCEAQAALTAAVGRKWPTRSRYLRSARASLFAASEASSWG